MSAALEELTRVLGAPPPASITTLPDDVLTRITQQIRTARKHQDDVVEDAVRVAVHGVPLPVRGLVKKALLG